MARRSDHPAAVGRPASGVRGGDLGTRLLAIIAVILVIWFLRATAIVAVPLVASVLIALAVMPVRDRVQLRLPRRFQWVGIGAAMSVIVLVIAGFFGALWVAAMQVVEQFPAGDGSGAGLLPQSASSSGAAPQRGTSASGSGEAEGAGGALSGLIPDSVTQLTDRLGTTIMDSLGSASAAILNSAMGLVSALVMIFFLTLLILVESEDWHRKIATLLERRDEWRLTDSAETIAQKLRLWMMIRSVLGLVTAILYGAWLWFFDVKLLVVWMVLTFLLNFIPTIGSIVAGALPTLYALVTQDIGTAIWVALGLLAIEQVMGNFVDPKVSGDRIAVSPLVVLVALLLWSWIWGIPGALLAGPVTVSLVVLGSHVPVLRPWALLLSDRTDMEGLRDATVAE